MVHYEARMRLEVDSITRRRCRFMISNGIVQIGKTISLMIKLVIPTCDGHVITDKETQNVDQTKQSRQNGEEVPIGDS